MTWSCSIAAMLGMLAFLLASLAAYNSLLTQRDMERWRAFHDHPANRNRRPLGPEDSDEWDER